MSSRRRAGSNDLVAEAPRRRPPRRAASSLVTRRSLSGKQERISRRPWARGLFQSGGTRWGKERAGQMMMGCVPRKRICRHSFSTGEWKPLMTQHPASRHLAAWSQAVRMTLPGQRAEQNSAILGNASKSRLPRAESGSGAFTLPPKGLIFRGADPGRPIAPRSIVSPPRLDRSPSASRPDHR